MKPSEYLKSLLITSFLSLAQLCRPLFTICVFPETVVFTEARDGRYILAAMVITGWECNIFTHLILSVNYL